MLKELARATGLLGDEAMAIRFIIMFLCAQFVKKSLFSSISSLNSPLRTFLIASLELGV